MANQDQLVRALMSQPPSVHRAKRGAEQWRHYLMAQAMRPPSSAPGAPIHNAMNMVAAGLLMKGERDRADRHQKKYQDSVSRAVEASRSGIKGWTNPDTGARDIPEIAPGRDAAMHILSQSPETAHLSNGLLLQALMKEQTPETFGAPVQAVDVEGAPAFVRFGNRGAVQPVEGFTPLMKPAAKYETIQSPYGRGGVGQRNSLTGKVEGYQAPTQPTSRHRDLQAAGFEPGTPQFAKAMKTAVTKPGVAVTVDQKGQTKEAETIGEYYGNQYVDLQNAAQNARTDDIQLNRVSQLVSGLGTGALAPLSQAFKSGLKSAGLDLAKWGLTDNVGQAEALEAIGTNITLEAVSKTKGAVSEKEMDLFLQTAPSLNKSPEGIALVVEMRREMNKRAREVAGLARKHLAQHKTMAGFDATLDRFHAENPLFTRSMHAKVSKLRQAGVGEQILDRLSPDDIQQYQGVLERERKNAPPPPRANPLPGVSPEAIQREIERRQAHQ